MTINPYVDAPSSDHFDGTRFFNPGEESTDRSLADILRWKLKEKAAPWPSTVVVQPNVPARRAEELVATFVGHATVLIQMNGLNILTDPLWSERASPLPFAGPKRVAPPGVRFDDLPPIDAVLVSHNHYDHLDIPTLKRLHEQHRPLFVTPLGNDTIIRKHLPQASIRAGDWGASISLGKAVDAHIVPANHWSSRSLRDRRMALWGGFMIRGPQAQVYFAGDTGYGSGRIFRDMRQRFGAVDLALIPIGAYAPEWFMSAQHTNPEDAVRIMLDLEASQALGIHWGSFQLTDEPREEPRERLAAALDRHGIDPTRFIAAVEGFAWSAATSKAGSAAKLP